jgi:hypothetical protein
MSDDDLIRRGDVLALQDRFMGVVTVEKIATIPAVTPGVRVKPPFHFDRYINGVLMAEGVTIERESNFTDAARVASRIASKGPNGEAPVLVLIPQNCDVQEVNARAWVPEAALDLTPQAALEDDPPCTCCGGTGVTYQTERRCACQPASDVAGVVWRPIETAPKGAEVNGKLGVSWMMLVIPDGDGGFHTANGMRVGDKFFAALTFYRGGPFDGKQFELREVEVRPTHWMPLLEFPALAAMEGKP